MSQHYFYTTHENEETKITMGWDRPLQGYFMVIEKDSDGDFPFWSNLDQEISHPQTLDDFLSVLDQFKLKIPEKMIDGILNDGKNNEGNKEVVHSNDNLTLSKSKNKRLDVVSIAQALRENENIEDIVERIMGKPKERTGQQWRYGTNHGSLVVTVKGEKKGLWHDFQTGEGGNLLHLIARQSGFNLKTDFQKILEEAANLLGTPERFMKDYNYKVSDNAFEKLTEVQQRSLKYARQLARESKLINGTLAEQYLKKHRGIMLEKFPESIRFHPGVYSRKNEGAYPALLAIAKNEQGEVMAVQAIYLDENTAQKADVNIKKQTWGLPSSGATVNLGEGTQKTEEKQKSAAVFFAEGIETGLSIYVAFGKTNVKVTLGKSNFKNIDASIPQNNIVFCLDNDGKPKEEKDTIISIAEKLSESNKIIWIAKPDIEGNDYNDLLMNKGKESIIKNIENAIKYDDFINSVQGALTLKTQ